MTTPDELRLRYLRERVLTASPAQRVAMLYDRLALDLARAAERLEATPDSAVFDRDAAAVIDHAVQIVTELLGSLDLDAGGPAGNLAALYGWLLRELLTVRAGDGRRLPAITGVVSSLRAAWAGAAEQLTAGTASAGAAVAWVS